MADTTITVGANQFLFTDQNGRSSYVTDGQTFVLVGAVAGGTRFTIKPAYEAIALDDGRKIRFDGVKSSLTVVSSTVASKNAGALWIEEDNGYSCKWKVRTCTIDDVSAPTKLTIVMERSDNPMITCTLTELSGA